MSPPMPSWLMTYFYPIALASISLLFVALEAWRPLRPAQRFWQRGRAWDFVHLVINGHFLGSYIGFLLAYTLVPVVDRAAAALGVEGGIESLAFASEWPLWLQMIVILFGLDFIQWNVHRLLHAVPLFWEFHKPHHSVRDEEMSWIVSFRFAWTEVLIYRLVQYLPLALMGFAWEAVMFHAVFGTLIGHLNHANLDFRWGPLRYLFNGPRMHRWHHDAVNSRVNYGIIFSCWDWIFGTAILPDEPPAHLGFEGVDEFPRDFVSHSIWPLPLLFRRNHAAPEDASEAAE